MTEKRKRRGEFDCLKILAAFLVIILHVNGYTYELSRLGYSMKCRYIYYVMEAFAYPAIHLFVMIGSWFMIEKAPQIRNIVKIWSQTWIVSISGMVLVLIFKNELFTILGGVECVAPFLGRAYWFVTEYIILMLMSPFLNRGIERSSDRELLVITFVWGCVISVFPTFLPVFPWRQDNSNIGLFILLYLITGCIRRQKRIYQCTLWVILWILSLIVLSLSAIILHYVVTEYEMFFYSYNGVFVIVEAVALFMIFSSKSITNPLLGKVLKYISESSLAVYLIHMHPLIKEHYTEWGVLRYINVNSPVLYAIQILATCFLIFIIGIMIGKPIFYISGVLSKWLQKFLVIRDKGKYAV